MSPLTEKGFVFMDDNYRVFFVTRKFGKDMLCYWHAENHWVILREITEPAEIIVMMNFMMLEKDAELYHNLHKQWENKTIPKFVNNENIRSLQLEK